jgi:hypothetical protein
MLALLTPAFFAALVALVLHGAPVDWTHIRIRWQPLALSAMGVQLVLFNPPLNSQPWALQWGLWIWVISMLGLLGAFLRNGIAGHGSRAPWLIAGLGAALNLLVVIGNGGQMPLSPQALVATKGEAHLAEHAADQDTPAELSNVVLIGRQTRLEWLGDVLPEPAWLPGANVFSLGDLLISVGFTWWAFWASSLGGRRRRSQAVHRSAGAVAT